MTGALVHRASSRALLHRLLEAPDLARDVRALPAPTFAALVRHVGPADAGELLALATTEQLVTAFDDDLFTADRPGGDEQFDPARFATWLEVLREAGDDVMAARFAELDEDFVTSALSRMMVVLDESALRERFEEVGEDAGRRADKALDGALSEEIDGYVLVAREPEGWDAALALVLALDRDHRELLVRVLDRCAAMDAELLDDLDELADVLTASASLEDDVAQAREERRAQLGFVAPEAARAFLALAKQPLAKGEVPTRDPMTTRALRDVDRRTTRRAEPPSRSTPLLDAVREAVPAAEIHEARPRRRSPFHEAMARLRVDAPAVFAERMEELGYLVNVLLAGSDRAVRPSEAADEVLARVERGARRLATGRHRSMDFTALLGTYGCDVLFRLGW